MSNAERRLDRLETLYQRPAEPPGPPCDPSRLTAAELRELQDLTEMLQAADIGPIPLDRRAAIRAALDTLTDEELARLEWLQRKACEPPVTPAVYVAEMEAR